MAQFSATSPCSLLRFTHRAGVLSLLAAMALGAGCEDGGTGPVDMDIDASGMDSALADGGSDAVFDGGDDATADAEEDGAVDAGDAANDTNQSVDATLDSAPGDAAPDAAADAEEDGTVDAAADAARDGGADSGAGADARVDSASDATMDAGNDASADAAVDARPDASMDAALDARPDSGMDAAVDARPDTASDATMDAGNDTSADAAVDARPDASMDAALDAKPDSAPDARSDARDSSADSAKDSGVADIGIDTGVADTGVTDAGLDAPAALPYKCVSADCAGHVVISEVATGGASGTDEFVELYNPTKQDTDISGVVLRYTASTGTPADYATLPAESVIKALGFYLLSSAGYVGPASDQPDAWARAFANAGGSVSLVAGGDTVDLLGWGSAAASETAPIEAHKDAASGSYERKAVAASTAMSMAPGGSDATRGNGFDTDDNAADFLHRAARQPQSSQDSTETP